MTRKLFSRKYTKRTRFTRQCIGEAIIALVYKKDFDSITISDIVKTAGVSRMTFYHYFKDKTEALGNYLQEVIDGYQEVCPKDITLVMLRRETSIRQALHYFDQYTSLFLTLEKAGLYSLMINAINDYMRIYVAPYYSGSIYELYFYAGALLNTFIEWEKGKKKEPVDEIVQILLSLTTDQGYSALPTDHSQMPAAVLL